PTPYKPRSSSLSLRKKRSRARREPKLNSSFSVRSGIVFEQFWASRRQPELQNSAKRLPATAHNYNKYVAAPIFPWPESGLHNNDKLCMTYGTEAEGQRLGLVSQTCLACRQLMIQRPRGENSPREKPIG